MKIVHLEDSAQLRLSVSRELQPINCNIVSVATVEEALVELDGADLLLSDWCLQYGTAEFAIETAKERGIPVLVLSGTPPMHLNVPYLQKPAMRDELVAAVQENLLGRPGTR